MTKTPNSTLFTMLFVSFTIHERAYTGIKSSTSHISTYYYFHKNNRAVMFHLIITHNFYININESRGNNVNSETVSCAPLLK